MVIKLIIFNVLHGDSALLEVENNGEYSYLVVDCNTNGECQVPVYNYLKSKGVTNINGILVSHFHQDHIDGIDKLLSSEFTIGRIFIPPVLDNNSEIHNKLISKYREEITKVLARTDDDLLASKLSSFATFLRYIKDNAKIVEECAGRESKFRVPGFPKEIEGTVYLPLRKMVGVIKQTIKNGEFGLDKFPNINDASIAVAFEFNGNKILLAGDASPTQWNEHKRQMTSHGIYSLDVNCLKAMHHGSKYNNTNPIFKYVFSSINNKTLIISADGVSHPHPEIFDLIVSHNLKPYCTNLSNLCVDEYERMDLSEVPEVFRIYLANYQPITPMPCQGDICFSYNSSDNKVSISNSTNTPCVYHYS